MEVAAHCRYVVPQGRSVNNGIDKELCSLSIHQCRGHNNNDPKVGEGYTNGKDGHNE